MFNEAHHNIRLYFRRTSGPCCQWGMFSLFERAKPAPKRKGNWVHVPTKTSSVWGNITLAGIWGNITLFNHYLSRVNHQQTQKIIDFNMSFCIKKSMRLQNFSFFQFCWMCLHGRISVETTGFFINVILFTAPKLHAHYFYFSKKSHVVMTLFYRHFEFLIFF